MANPKLTVNTFNDVCVINQKTITVVGDGGVIFRSEDAGKTWQHQESQTALI